MSSEATKPKRWLSIGRDEAMLAVLERLFQAHLDAGIIACDD
jgi:hypothetical protein